MSVRVSVVVPLFNKASYVRRALESLAAQFFADFEVVVVDDGSTDGGSEVVEAFSDPRIRLVRQENKGEGAARNRGVVESSGDVIAMLDADDEWDPGFLETIIDLRRRYPDAGLLATGYRSIYRGGFTLETAIPGCEAGRIIRDYFVKARRVAVVWSSAQAIPRDTLNRIGLFARDPIGIDVDMWGRIALRYPLAYSGRILATYHNDVAGYRMVSHYQRQLVFPPFVRSARAALERGEIDNHSVRSVHDYLNHLMLQYVYRAVAAGDRHELRRALREEFYREGGWNGTLAILQLVSSLMPLRVLNLLLQAKQSRWGWMAGVDGTRDFVRRA